jgi:hypothetical protein
MHYTTIDPKEEKDSYPIRPCITPPLTPKDLKFDGAERWAYTT